MEEERRSVQSLLGSGETLLWMEAPGTTNLLRQMAPALIPLTAFFGLFIAFVTFIFEFGSGPPQPDAPFLFQHPGLLPPGFFGVFYLIAALGVYSTMRLQIRATRYALTNRRLLTVFISKQRANPGNIGLEDIVSVEALQRRALSVVRGGSIGLAEIVSVEARERGGNGIGSGDLLLEIAANGARSKIRWHDIPQAQDAARRILDAQAKHRAAPPLETPPALFSAPNTGTLELRKGTDRPGLFVATGIMTIGLIVVGAGIGFAFFLDASIQPGGLIFAAFGLVLAVAGGAGLLWREELSVDFAMGTYRGRRGLLPKAQWFSGPLSDFGPVVLTQEQRSQGESGTYTVWCAYATWRDGQRRRIRIHENRDRIQSEVEAQKLAAQLQVAFEPATAIATKRR